MEFHRILDSGVDAKPQGFAESATFRRGGFSVDNGECSKTARLRRLGAAMAYTLEDLNKAKEDFRVADARAENSNRNNPEFGQADIRAAQDRVEIITAELKRLGLLPKTEKEKLEDAIDAQFLNAKSKQIVEYEGKRYRLKFAPARMSRSGKTVTKWSRWWEKV
jgi:hypothetical protein